MSLCCAIDPGKHAVGISVFNYATQDLVAAFWLDGFDDPSKLARALRTRLKGLGAFIWATIEVPQIYQTAQQKGPQKDLIDVTLTAGACALALLDLGATVKFLEPREWKGQIPKPVTQRRVDKALTQKEAALISWPIKSKAHNVYDAIHLGLKAFTRRTA